MDNENNIDPGTVNESGARSSQDNIGAPQGAQTNNYGQPGPQNYYQNSYQQYQAPPTYYNQQRQPEKKRKSGFWVLIAFVIILSLAVGGLLTAYVVMPMINAEQAQISENAQQGQDDQQGSGPNIADNQDGPDQPAQDKPAKPQTTSSADIGGEAPNIDQSGNPIVQIAEKVSPSVVGVTVSADQTVGGQATQSQEYGYGTGFIISENGYIATNNHVVAGSDSVQVTLIDGSEYDAQVVGVDASTDLAVLKIDAQGLTVASFGDSDALKVGETVVAIGNPLGSNLAGSVTAGIVSAKDRVISTNGYTQKYIQTDAAINPGNSGGPLVNIEGQVIGINTLKTYLAGYDDYGVPIGTEGIGFAIPTKTALPIIEQLMETGSVERPGIGISCLVDVTNAFNPEGSPEGVTVAEVVAGSPAEDANLMVGDIILDIDGTETPTVEVLTDELQKHAVGVEVEIRVWRDGEEYKTIVTVGDLNNMG